MPELPEVKTIVNQLRPKIIGRKIIDFWFAPDFRPKNISLVDFKNKLKNRRFTSINQRGKNLIFHLEGGLVMLIHLKLTGHFLLGRWQLTSKEPIAQNPELSQDPANKYLRFILILDNGEMLALSDLRKFAKVMLVKESEVSSLKDLNLGPEPIAPDFNFNKFKELFLKVQKRRPRQKIKALLMDQKFLAGIGNIYSDEILFEAKISPLRPISQISPPDLERLFRAMGKILNEAIKKGGSTVGFGDYRNLYGQPGKYSSYLKVYRRTNEKCFRCGHLIKQIKFGSRSSYYCPYCQK